MFRSLTCLLAALVLSGPAFAQTPAKQLFGAVRGPSEHAPAPFGTYNRGCLAGAAQLPETGPHWQAMRLSRNRNWAHPETVSFIKRLSIAATRIGWSGLYIGDISQPRGGPMLTGHASHQLGLDIDIWMLRPARLDLSVPEREALSSISVRTADQRNVNGNWTPEHHRLLRAAAMDPAVARIFVNAAIKAALCAAEPAAADRDWLRKVRPWWGHDSHFHVRLSCPAGAVECEDQDPIPAGDGCGEELAWWFSDEALNPAPSVAPPRVELTMDDLPRSCASVLAQ
jgi:penicillin-insensitive murein endopeptidase